MGGHDEQNSHYAETASCNDDSKPLQLAGTKSGNL
jgi:hypothetical protein